MVKRLKNSNFEILAKVHISEQNYIWSIASSMNKKVASAKSARRKKIPVQEEGKLMTNNPHIPPELDEDIDDDLAFDSDDERMYGSFFSSEGRNQRKGDKIAKQEENLYNYSEDGQFSGSDDEYMNLDDILDMNLKKEKRTELRNKKARDSESGVQVAKKRRTTKDALSTETLFPDHKVNDGFNSTLQKVIKGTSSAAPSAVSRLEQALRNKNSLISVDMDEKTKDAATRRVVREIMDENMKKYKPLLRELSLQRVRLPLVAPESNPVPSSTGAITSVSIGRVESLDGSAGKDLCVSENKRVAQDLARKMGNLLSDAGISSSSENTNTSREASSLKKIENSELSPASFTFSPKFSHEDPTSLKIEEQPSKQYMTKLKAMLATENSRRKRFNKIKSKTYRRILRKEKEHEKEKREKAFEILHPELARKHLAEKLIKARAVERVTQKHKNTSTWVKHAKKFALFDTQKKDAINEQLSIHQRLMRKMDEEAGEELYHQYADNDENSEASEEEEKLVDDLLTANSLQEVKKVASNLFKSMEETSEDFMTESSPAIRKMRQELKDMKFMKSAKERAVNAYAEELRELRADAEKNLETESKIDSGLDAKNRKNKIGRIRFSVENNSLENIALTGRGIEGKPSPPCAAHLTNSGVPPTSAWRNKETEVSEFVGCREGSSIVSSRVTVFPEIKKAEDKEFNHLKSTVEGLSEGKELNIPSYPSNNPEIELHENQTYLISRAFADNAIDDDFVREKEAQVKVMMKPEDSNSNLPGWGEWGGTDERLNKRHSEKLAHAALQQKIEKTFLLKSRADAVLDHVILNHDGVELIPDRMKLHMIPRPFSNSQEFVRSIRQPVGPEWTSSLTFVEGVQPRVEVKQGHAIVPLDLSLRRDKAQTKRRKMEIQS